jgi:16S rRNA (cytosine1402-N4)-methyltransferase
MQTSAATPQQAHQPVLFQETLAAIAPRDGGKYIDATLGAGGHAEGILEGSSPSGSLLGLDLDPRAIELSTSRLEKYGQRARIVRSSYTRLLEVMHANGWEQVDGVLFDLGVSSMQLDNPEGGFSFKNDVPLDMRFDPQNPICAETMVNNLPEEELAEILWKYGEEKSSRRIAKAICASRPIRTTGELASIVRKALGHSSGRLDPATRTFQAIRIAVNSELQVIEESLPKAVEALNPGGRLAVISFHSLEDRLVKQFLRRESSDCICSPGQPVCTCGHKASLKDLNRKGITATEVEVKANPRSRSARLRAAEKLGLA